MKRLLIIFSTIVFAVMSVTAWAQNNPKLSYQAVVRDNQNRLLTNNQVNVEINILRPDNSVQYTETFTAVPTNQNGLMSLLIGNSTSWDYVVWLNAKINVKITLPGAMGMVESTSDVSAVPLSINTIHSSSVDPTAIPQSDWNETNASKCTFIMNKPNIPDSVQNYLTSNNYVTETTLDNRHYLTSDSTVIKDMQDTLIKHNTRISANYQGIIDTAGNLREAINGINTNLCATVMDCDAIQTMRDSIQTNAQNIHADSTTLASRLDALESATMDCDDVKDCIKDTLGYYTPTAGLASVATTGSYTDLTNTPTIPTTVAELTDASDYAKLAAANTFSGKNTFSDNVNFTDTVVVPSGFTFGTTTTATCNDIAVNACDLLAVFDSLAKRMDNIQENLQNQIDSLKAILDSSKTAPVILGLSGTPHSNSIDAVARLSFGGSPITAREFCYSTTNDIAGATCVSATGNEKTLEGLDANTEYYLWMKATNEIGTATSESVKVKTLPESPEMTNTKVSASDDHVTVSADIDLKGADNAQLTLCYVKTGETDTTCLEPKTVTGTSLSEEIPGLDTNTTYTIVAKLDNGAETPATVSEDVTTIALKVTSDTTISVTKCGDTLTVTYTATIANPENYTFAWKVNGTDSTATGKTLVVNYTAAGTYKVTCVATNNAETTVTAKDTITTTVQQGALPSMGICTDCDEGKAYIKSVANVSSASWKLGGVEKSTAKTVSSFDLEPGTYTVEVKSSGGCTVTYNNITIDKQYTHCTVTNALRQTDIATHKNYEWGTGTQLDSVSDHEGNIYEVVQIGDQCWLKENMRATTSPSTGSTILMPMVKSNSSKSASYYKGDAATYGKYGVLYNWCAVVDTFYAAGGQPELANAADHSSTAWTCVLPAGNRRGICPEGWHVPTDAEWTTMTTTAGVGVDSGTGAGKLAGGCDWNSYSTSSACGDYSYADRDAAGFHALPAGYYNGSSFNAVGNAAYFWSSTPNGAYYAYDRYLYYLSSCLNRIGSYRYNGYSVRCLRDDPGITLGEVTKTDSTITTMTISAPYTGDKAVTSATICAYTDESCTTPAGECATGVTTTSPITGTVTGLTPNTQYYVKVSATTAGGTESKVGGPFGTAEPPVDTITFISNGGTGTMAKQTVTRGEATAITANTYTHDGNWAFTGWNDACDGNGTMYADNANITTDGNVTLYANWHTWCTGTPAANESGTSRIDSVKDHQGNWYEVVQIGDQCWLAENMRATTSPSTGSTILMTMVRSYSSKSASYYKGDAATYGKYGVMYNWCAVVDTFYAAGGQPELANAADHSSTAWTCVLPAGNRRGICPEGWHVPTDAEWTTMTTTAGVGVNSGTGAGKLAGGCDWQSEPTSSACGDYSYAARDAAGFHALPAGYYSGSSFTGVGRYANFWSSTPYGTDGAYYRVLNSFYGSYMYRSYNNRHFGYSVRCLRD